MSRPGTLAASGGLGMEEKAPSSRYAILQNHLGNSPSRPDTITPELSPRLGRGELKKLCCSI